MSIYTLIHVWFTVLRAQYHGDQEQPLPVCVKQADRKLFHWFCLCTSFSLFPFYKNKDCFYFTAPFLVMTDVQDFVMKHDVKQNTGKSGIVQGLFKIITVRMES